MTFERQLFRIALVIATLVAALAIPNLGVLISLIGALSGAFLALIVPAAIDLR